MEKTKKRWVDTGYFLRCRKVQEIIYKSVCRRSSKIAHMKLIEKACMASEVLKYHEGRVKHLKRVKYHQDFDRVFYLERKGDFSPEVLEDIFKELELPLESVVVNWKGECCFVELSGFSLNQIPDKLS